MQPIEYVEPLERAYAGMKRRLFNPADVGKWFTIGFAAWLAQLGENGGGGFNFQLPGGDAGPEAADLAALKAKFMANIGLVIGIASVVLTIALALGILFLWLSSRGKFVFLDNTIRDQARITEPWAEYRREGNSLFVWRLVFGLLSGIVVLGLVGLAGLLVWRDIATKQFSVGTGLVFGAGLLVLLVLALVIGVVDRLLQDFVVPLMWRHRVKANEGWRRFGRLVSGRAGSVVVYLLLHFAVSLAVGLIVLLAGFCTCCCGFLILALPVVNATALLPVSMTLRLFPLEFLRQFGPDGDCLAAPPPPLPALPEPPPGAAPVP